MRFCSGAAISRVLCGKPQQELSNTAWAWATQLHDPGEAALRALERELERRPSEFSPQVLRSGGMLPSRVLGSLPLSFCGALGQMIRS